MYNINHADFLRTKGGNTFLLFANEFILIQEFSELKKFSNFVNNDCGSYKIHSSI